jgi:hypothetical protein
LGSIPEKKKVAAVEGWCHRLGDDNDNRDVGACDKAAALPRYKQIADSKQRVLVTARSWGLRVMAVSAFEKEKSGIIDLASLCGLLRDATSRWTQPIDYL